MNDALQGLLALITANDGINDKAKLARIVFEAFGLTKDRSVYYCTDFAIRFSSAAKEAASNTVASLSRLQKYDDRPFVVCVVTETTNHCRLANTTFLKKISHSSQQLREDNIRGSFNVSGIVQQFEGITNTAANFGRLFPIHAGIGFDGNLARLVEATNNITPTGIKFAVTEAAAPVILAAPQRAQQFVQSAECAALKAELDAQVAKCQSEIPLLRGGRSGEDREHGPCVDVSGEAPPSDDSAQTLVGTELAGRHAV